MSDRLPPEFWHGVEQFNQEDFYGCHDTLEEIWLEASEPERSLYQGILQVAVGIYHLGNQNRRGAILLLGEGMKRLSAYSPEYAGLDIRQFLVETQGLLTQLQYQDDLLCDRYPKLATLYQSPSMSYPYL